MSKVIHLMVAGLVLAASGLIAASTTALGDEPVPATSVKKLEAGLSPVAQLLRLMDTDKNGKVSKQEFMSFMEAEFNLADADKSGELDSKELQQFINRVSHPVKGPGR
jgi:hypothetical protein